MTVPTLLSKYQKQTYVVGLKKAYAQVKNAVQMIPLSEGCPAGDYECAGVIYKSDTGWLVVNNATLAKLLSQNLKAVKYCPYENDTSYKKCFGENYTTKSIEAGIYDPTRLGYNFVLADGTFWSVHDVDYNIVVDLNGAKGPGAYGRDRFVFKLKPDPALPSGTDWQKPPQGSVIPHGSKIYGGGYWKDGNSCTTERVASGTHSWDCTGRVLEEDAMNY